MLLLSWEEEALRRTGVVMVNVLAEQSRCQDEDEVGLLQ